MYTFLPGPAQLWRRPFQAELRGQDAADDCSECGQCLHHGAAAQTQCAGATGVSCGEGAGGKQDGQAPFHGWVYNTLQHVCFLRALGGTSSYYIRCPATQTGHSHAHALLHPRSGKPMHLSCRIPIYASPCTCACRITAQASPCTYAQTNTGRDEGSQWQDGHAVCEQLQDGGLPRESAAGHHYVPRGL